jgi:magnesium chelatase family protein
LEVAAAGGHNVFMKGVPGAGKTMLSRALPGILPDLIAGSLKISWGHSCRQRICPAVGSPYFMIKISWRIPAMPRLWLI